MKGVNILLVGSNIYDSKLFNDTFSRFFEGYGSQYIHTRCAKNLTAVVL